MLRHKTLRNYCRDLQDPSLSVHDGQLAESVQKSLA